jgi:hypothetical protein
MHLLDYTSGYSAATGTANISLKSNVTGTYSVDLTVIGVGTYANL